MAEEKARPLRPEMPGDEEKIKKLLLAEGEITIPIGDGKKKEVYWVRQGFNWKTYFDAYARKKIKEALDLKVLSVDHFLGNPKGVIDGKNTIFNLDPHSVIEGTLKVKIGSALKREGIDYIYDPSWRALFFLEEAPQDEVSVEYDYYDPKTYDEIVRDAQNCMLICLAVREKDNHDKKVFDTPEDVERLSRLEIFEILGEYVKKITLTEEDLKNSQASSPSEGDAGLQKDMGSTLTEKKSGGNSEELMKKKD